MMQDPMANLAGGNPTTDATTTFTDSKQIFDPFIMSVNFHRMDRIHAVMGIVSGCVAGIIGLTGWQGFGTKNKNTTTTVGCNSHQKMSVTSHISRTRLFFFVVLSNVLFFLVCFLLLHTLVSVAIWVVKMDCQLATYSKQTKLQFFVTMSFQQSALSFTLFWTLFYGLVYLY